MRSLEVTANVQSPSASWIWPCGTPSRKLPEFHSTGFSLTATAAARSNQESSSTPPAATTILARRSEEHTSELQSPDHLVCRLLLEKKKHSNMQLRVAYGIADPP